MLASIRNALAGLIDWITEQLATYMKALPVPAASPLALTGQEDGEPVTEMDAFARNVAAYILAAAAMVLAFVPWVSPALSYPLVDFMTRLAAVISV